MTSTATHTADAPLVELSVQDIILDDNVRELKQDHVDRLAGSIKMLGILVPLVVSREADGFHLVAGYHRYAAAKRANLTLVPIVERKAFADGHDSLQTDAAVENIVRQDLTPYEEAVAVKRAVDGGLTKEGAAQALGWSEQLVTLRLRVFDMPTLMQPWVGETLPLGNVAFWAGLHEKFPKIGNMCAEYMQEKEVMRSSNVTHVVERAGQTTELVQKHGVYVVDLAGFDFNRHDLERAKLWGRVKKANKEKLESLKPENIWRGPRKVPILGEFIDQARAMGCLLEVETDSLHRPGMTAMLIDDPERKLLIQGINDSIAAYEPPRAPVKEKRTPADRTPADQARLDANRERREAADAIAKAHDAQGARILNQLAKVPVDMDVARFFVYGLLFGAQVAYGKDPEGDSLWKRGLGGIMRPVWEAQPASSNGKLKPAKLRYPRFKPVEDSKADRELAVQTLKKFLDVARTPEELFGRALCLYAGTELCIPKVLPSTKSWWNRFQHNGGSAGSTGTLPTGESAAAFEALLKKHKVLAPEMDAAMKAWKKIDAAEAKAAKL